MIVTEKYESCSVLPIWEREGYIQIRVFRPGVRGEEREHGSRDDDRRLPFHMRPWVPAVFSHTGMISFVDDALEERCRCWPPALSGGRQRRTKHPRSPRSGVCTGCLRWPTTGRRPPVHPVGPVS